VLFVATAQADDDEMSRRIAAHRAERPAEWVTLESPMDLVGDIDRCVRSLGEDVGVVIVDCLTLWVSNVLLTLDAGEDAEMRVAEHVRALLRSIDDRPYHWILISNEVGLGVVPATPLGRRYRDALGRANQLVAAAADHVTLMIAGLAIPLAPAAREGRCVENRE
jgi:adenosylcobinamide kinase / adenosylcobinamide-phosphate guanylyltransferase